VNESIKIVEKDPEAGYVLFELRDDKKTFQGQMELVRVKDDEERRATRVLVKLVDRPSYMEEGLLERLGDKLREELGDPPAPPPPPPPPPREDRKDGAEGGEKAPPEKK